MSSVGETIVEEGWVLEGMTGDGRSVRLVLGDTELARTYLGLVIGRHPALCERVVADPTVSRRHLRIGIERGSLLIEDLHSLNGTLLDGELLLPFQPTPLEPGQTLILGELTLGVARLAASS